MSIQRKKLQLPQKELQLLATFPRPPPGPRSPARLSLQSPGLTPRPSNYGFISTSPAHDGTDADSLYDPPGPPLPPRPQPRIVSTLNPAPPSKHDAELQIILDHPSKVCAPGETLTGYITGWSTAEEHVHIIFLGKATTTLKDPKMTHTNRTPLVFQVTRLKPGFQPSMPRFGLSLPHVCGTSFENLNNFVPGDVAGTSYWTTTWPAQSPFENEAGNPLPPSMHMEPRSVSKLSNVQGSASIEYTLIAVRSSLNPHTKRFIPNATFSFPLTLTTLRLTASKIDLLSGEKHHTTSSLSIQTAALAKERKLRLREQICDAFNTSAPTFYFSVKVTAPRLSVPGANVNIGIATEVLPPPLGKLYNFAIPDITVMSITFRVRSYTGVRVLLPAFTPSQSRINPSGVASTRETFKKTEFQQTQTPVDATFVPQEGGFEGQACVATVTLPKELLPSFKSYSAWRGYRLECAIRVRVAGKEEEAKVASDLNIVAGGDARDDLERTSADDGVSRRIAETIVTMGMSG